MKNNRSPKMILNKLILVGREKNYVVPFSSGLNIIFGDSDTGKSSILNLIDYLLGASEVAIYDEIEMHGRYALLEVNLNNQIYTIKRDIFDPNALIEVYKETIEHMDQVFPKEYGPHSRKEGPAGYLSEFLLEALNIPRVKLKQAPSKEDSKMSTLSFRDILKYCFMDQDEVGNKDILDQKNFSVFTKNKETFKFIHNLLDDKITLLQEEIGEKNRVKQSISQQFTIISSFLREAQLESTESLEEKSLQLAEALNTVDSEMTMITHSMKSNNEQDEELRKLIVNKQSHLDELSMSKMYKNTQLEQNLRLKKDYRQDIEKLKASLEVIRKMPNHESHHVNCPICESELKASRFNELFSHYDSTAIEQEIKSLKNREKELSALIEQDREAILRFIATIENEKDDIRRAKEILDLKTQEFVSPFIAQRDLLNTRRGEITEEVKRIEYLLKLRKQVNDLTIKSDQLIEQIDELNEKLELLKANAPSVEGVLGNIGDLLNDFLTSIPIRNAYGISISRNTFLPVVREKDYSKLTSGGLRTLVSVGYLISILRNSLGNQTNFPSLVMVDTVGKYIGKTKPKYLLSTDQSQDRAEGLNDPLKYRNIFAYLVLMCEELLHKYDFQIIIVDNDLPEDLEDSLEAFVVKKFSVVPRAGYDIGFIDNAIPRV
ncbi:hypothetical protein QF049_000489 [Paenibacillus sp. W4I10]|uniref:hypothetical protein n=1 Tax=Paenibacillus sp. W4I10 TaxID=3042298 RepID=UPI002780CEA0|nr:hypothetical protein [Paenibacillus sp. W4I10]MDQ0719228.1 hypothetical protein [Paenibacillus sp. W4I10]